MKNSETISVRHFLISIVITVGYFTTCMLLNDARFFSHLMMSLGLFIAITFVFDFRSSFLSIKNIFFWLFFAFGLFLRYIFIVANPEKFCSFILVKTQFSNENFNRTSLIVLITVLIFAIVYRSRISFSFKKSSNNIYYYKPVFEYNYKRLLIIWMVTFTLSYVYNIMYLNVGLDFNSYPRFYYAATMLRNVVRAISYMFLLSYFQENNKKNVSCYIIFIITDIILSFLQAWKGQILYEVLAFFVLYLYSGHKLKRKTIFILVGVFLIVYPTITIYREFLIGLSTYNLSFGGILDYYQKVDFISVVSERFAYYDEIFHCLNIDPSIIERYLNACGTIVSQFLSGIIPRVLWPNKPIGSQGLVITKYIYGKSWVTASTITYIGDFFLSYGYIGVVIGDILYASVLKNIQFKINTNDLLGTGISVVISFIVLNFMEGTVGGKLVTLVLTVILLFVVKKLCINRIIIED